MLCKSACAFIARVVQYSCCRSLLELRVKREEVHEGLVV